MKKILYAFAGVVTLLWGLSSCSMFKYDVLDGPNAQINGCLLDIQTGEKIGVETSSSDAGALVVIEQNWDGESEQSWLVRFDGMYTNNLIFAADYVFSTKKLPCYQPANNAFTVKAGKNRMNLSMLPFCRILNPEIRYDAAAKKVIATFSVELGDPAGANQITNVALCGNTQLFVGCNYQNLAKNDAGAKKKDVKPGELITLEIDATPGSDLFGVNSRTGAPYVQDRYFRIAAMATGNGYNSNKYYNFSPIFKLSADFSTVEEVVWDENDW